MMTSEVRIERIGQRGQGVGADLTGNIYFVSGTLPGDVAIVEFKADAKRYRDARLVELKVPSSARLVPQCKYFGECGGCDWLNWTYEEQLKAKQAMLIHVLERAGVGVENLLPIQGAAKQLGYRNRIQLRREGSKTGFYQKLSHEIVDVESCAVADPRLNAALSSIRDEPQPSERVKIELAVTDSGEVARWENQPHASGGFVQVNPEQNARLRESVVRALQGVKAERVLELYCGNGNLTFAYAKTVSQVLGIDSSREAICLAEATARGLGLTSVSFKTGLLNAGAQVNKQVSPFRFETLLVDPPRSGVGVPLKRLAHSGLKNLVYVSCAPLTFAQDVRLLEDAFVVTQVQPIDMFPHTRHIELVATLRRR